jgi:hypothetical protein
VATLLVSALFWCEPFSGASTFLVAEHFWCQHFSGASPFLVPALFWSLLMLTESQFRIRLGLYLEENPIWSLELRGKAL